MDANNEAQLQKETAHTLRSMQRCLCATSMCLESVSALMRLGGRPALLAQPDSAACSWRTDGNITRAAAHHISNQPGRPT